MFFVEATLPGLQFIFQQQDFVNDGDFVCDLDLRQGVAHGLADVLGVRGGAAQNNAEADDGGGT